MLAGDDRVLTEACKFTGDSCSFLHISPNQPVLPYSMSQIISSPLADEEKPLLCTTKPLSSAALPPHPDTCPLHWDPRRERG
jgi:hypothetical protein